MTKLFFFFLFSATSLYAQTPGLIKWFASGDLVGTGDFSEGEKTSNPYRDGAYVREFEFSANAAVDHTWDGVLTLAYHKELQQAEEHIEIHEAFIFSPKIISLSTLKLGKFFLGFGRLNRFHRHDWAFTEAPVYHKAFFGNEGVKDTGVEYNRLVGGEYLNWEATLGLVSGSDFVHTAHDHEEGAADHVEEGQPHTPTGYLRISAFKEIETTEGLETGVNFISRTNAEVERIHYAGLDFVYKKRSTRFLESMIQAEVWNRASYHSEESHTMEDLGGYLYYQKGFNRNHALGLRYDFFAPSLHEGEERHVEVDGFHILNDYNAYTLNYTYFNSEFMLTRLAVEHSSGHELDEKEESVTRVFAQLVFTIGAHPAHAF